MEETENHAATQATAAPSPRLHQRFISGEFGLAKTYWLCGVVPNLMANIVLRNTSSYTVAYWVGAAMLIYLVGLLVAIWNAGTKYTGPKIWPVLAFLVIFSGILRSIGPVLELGKH